jgi:hypothetical protein
MRRLPGERSLNLLARRLHRQVALQGCLPLGPKSVYAGLLGHARARKYSDGWAYFKFIEIFGSEPRQQDRGPPVPPPPELQAWIALLPKPSKKAAQ